VLTLARFVKETMDRNEAILFAALDGLTPDDLHRRIAPDANPIGWTMWHLSRTQGNHVSSMAGKEHCYIDEGWHAKFGRPAERADRGTGHTAEQVSVFRAPDVATLVDFYKAVRRHTDALLDALRPDDPERQVPAVRGDGTVPLHHRIQMFVMDNIQHTGQIAYLRGLLRGRGWLAV